jgi:hypothetical protein
LIGLNNAVLVKPPQLRSLRPIGSRRPSRRLQNEHDTTNR